MCMSRKRERDARRNVGKHVRIVCHQDDRRIVFHCAKGRSHIVNTRPQITDASDPHRTRGSLRPHRRFFYDSYPVLLERPLDAIVIEPAVMIAEHSKDPGGSSERFQFAGDLFRRYEPSAGHALNDEVAKDADDIGTCRVGALDGVVQFRGTVER